MPLPSELSFGSFLQYSPRGETPLSKQSKSLTIAVKNDSTYLTKEGVQRIIPYIAKLLAAEVKSHEVLRQFFQPAAVFVPAPKSAPLVSGGLWPTQRICDAMRQHGLGADVQHLLVRRQAVQKAATAGSGQRPTPRVHYDSMEVSAARPMFPPQVPLIVVDDVVTRGAMLVACHARLQEAYPANPIGCFALIRTMSGVEIDTFISPVVGSITHQPPSHLHREP